MHLVSDRMPCYRSFGRVKAASKYSTITGASPATATRDLVDLMDKGALVRTGELRHARYNLSVPFEAGGERHHQ